jgi:hypothetical protein
VTTGASPSGAITALAHDEAGNEAASASWRRIIDNTPPGAQRLSRQPSNRPVGQCDVGVLTLRRHRGSRRIARRHLAQRGRLRVPLPARAELRTALRL